MDNASHSPVDPRPEAKVPSSAPPVVPDPTQLGRSVSADFEAIRNDMEQARELAAEYQRALAGKSNELAAMNQLFEKTRLHLIQLELSIKNLREERHRLANEAMRAVALEQKLEQVIKE